MSPELREALVRYLTDGSASTRERLVQVLTGEQNGAPFGAADDSVPPFPELDRED